ncbi:MAG: fused MFS/spermidine synthase [Pseudomonadales bacterium]|nr:fused MFS/spermidine synthase [Pseudomonadales bacterium]
MPKLTILLCFCLLSLTCLAKDIHREKSLYRNIVVKENYGRRCLVFAVKRGDRNQTCIDLKDPQRLVFPYVKMTLAGLLINPHPKRILVVGLGGGSMPNGLNTLLPEAQIDVVEIDEAVVRVAKKYFAFSESALIKVTVADARVFIKRAQLRQQSYDLIILDAFTGDYIPEHLMTREFLQETKSLLTETGVLVANTFSTSRLYDHESVTYSDVFGKFINFKKPGTGNRVILASMQPLPDNKQLRNTAKQLSAKMHTLDVDILSYPYYMRRGRDWNTAKRVLTDQFNPANLLQGKH